MALVPSKASLLISFLILSNLATAFFKDFKLPWTPNYYKHGDRVELLVNTIESSQTQLPYSYYNLPFVCPATHKSNAVHLSLGEVLKGDRIWQSDYRLEFGKDEPCIRLCDRIVSISGTKRLDELIQQNYMVEWLIDNLPASTTFITPKNYKEIASKYYIAGFPLGFVENGVSYIHNHVMIVVRWHKEGGDDNKKTIVGFEIYPKSVSDYHCPGASKNFQNFGVPHDTKEKLLIPFTYSVYWREDFDLSWYNRWDMFRNPTTAFGNDLKVHWISIINSLVIVSFLSLLVAIVFVRTLRSDFKTASAIDPLNKELENLVDNGKSDKKNDDLHNNSEANWKSVAGDVFIQPPHPIWLSFLGGSGIQLCITFVGVVILFSSGIHGPDNTILSTAIGLFVYAGFVAGFASVQFFKNFTYDPSVSWRRVAFFSGSFLTGIILIILLIMNVIIGARESSLALPFGTVMVLISVYVLLEIPFALIGGYVSNKFHIVQYWINRIYRKRGIKAPPIVVKPPTTPSLISKSIPKQPLYNRSIVSLLLIGLFPFGILFVEIAFLFQSLWMETESVYYMYGFLSLTFILLVIVVGETSIIATYLRLNSGDHRWQWKSFSMGTLSIFLYLMSYTIYYLVSHLKLVSLVSVLLYLVYTSMLNILISVACGSIALTSSTIFVYTIYSSTKKD